MSDALEVLKLVSGPDFQRRLNDYVRAKQEAEDAADKADQAREANQRTLDEIEKNLVASKDEIAHAKANADMAAEEAAKRIKLAVDIETRIKKALEVLRGIL